MNFKGCSAVSKILPRTGSINWAGFRIRILDLDPDQAKEKKSYSDRYSMTLINHRGVKIVVSCPIPECNRCCCVTTWGAPRVDRSAGQAAPPQLSADPPAPLLSADPADHTNKFISLMADRQKIHDQDKESRLKMQT